MCGHCNGVSRRLSIASKNGARVLIVRAGDFFGPQAGNSWFSQGLVKPGKPVTAVSNPSRRGVGHQWSYLPDVARTMVELLAHRDSRSSSSESRAHAAPLTGSGSGEIHGRDALNAWVGGIHSVLPDLAFTIEVGPISNKDYLVVRWRAHGTYGGGFPGASGSAVGREVTFTGTDTLRIVNGQIAEYWANADSLLFVQQLGVSKVPGAAQAH